MHRNQLLTLHGQQARWGTLGLPRIPILAVLLLCGILAGCVSRGAARRDQLKAYEEGRQKALQEQMHHEPSVLFRGDVRNQSVPWREGLTLAEALLSAQYTWGWDPRVITVFRNGQGYPVNPKGLLRGSDNPVLEPGDLVEVRH